MNSPDHRLSLSTVLVVDDDDLLRRLMTQVLEDAGYRVIPAENGRVAWELLWTDVGCIDAVVTDVMMPEMNCSSSWCSPPRAGFGRALPLRRPGPPVLAEAD